MDAASEETLENQPPSSTSGTQKHRRNYLYQQEAFACLRKAVADVLSAAGMLPTTTEQPETAAWFARISKAACTHHEHSTCMHMHFSYMQLHFRY